MRASNLGAVLCIAILFTFIGCGGPSGSTGDAGASADGGTGVPSVFRVQFDTSQGSFVAESHRDWAPNGVDRFYALVQAHYYDDTRVFRVLTGFVAQFGINGDPAVTAMWTHATIPADPVVQHNQRGFVSYAMAGTDRGSRTTNAHDAKSRRWCVRRDLPRPALLRTAIGPTRRRAGSFPRWPFPHQGVRRGGNHAGSVS